MAKATAGFFRTQAEGEQAKQTLLEAGFSQDQVSFLAGNVPEPETPKVGPVLKHAGTESEAASDAFVGGAIGLAAGVIAFVLPGIGPLFAAGPIAGGIAGLTAGVATGGGIGLVRDHGVSDEQAEFYAEGVRWGGALLTGQDVGEER